MTAFSASLRIPLRGAPALLVATAAASSFWFACVTPLPAIAVAAASALTPRAAILTVLAAWVANQLVGYTALGYPLTANTALWGVAIGIAALAAAGVACLGFRRAGASFAVTLITAFAGAFAAYEITLFAASFALGGAGGFAPGIVAQIALLDTAWTAGLVAALELARLAVRLGPAGRGAPTPAP